MCSMPPIETMTQKYKALYILFLMEILIYIDRGILPGCVLAINTFISRNFGTNQPSFYFGIAQGSFIGGLSLSCLVFAHANHTFSLHKLISCGMLIWLLAGIIVATAPMTGSLAFYTFLLGRIISGCGEGALIALVPPYILKHTAGRSTGYWMGTFCAILPVGTAIGYVFGGAVSKMLAWNYSFFILCGAACIPIGIFIFFPSWVMLHTNDIEQRINPSPGIDYQVPANAFLEVSILDTTTAEKGIDQPCVGKPTEADVEAFNNDNGKVTYSTVSVKHLINDIWGVLTNTEFMYLSIAYASYSAVIISFSTFGSAYLQGLNFVKDEFTASTVMGAIVAGLGVLGGFLGGGLSAFSVKKASQLNSSEHDLSNKSEKHRYETVELLSLYLIPVTVVSLIFLTLTSVGELFPVFMLLLLIGLLFMFCTQSSLNIATMLVVPTHHRNLAIAISTVLLHIIGDVPAPIIVGLLKDKLAPNCSQLDEATKTVFPACYKETFGQRITIFIMGIWLVWMVFGVTATYFCVRRKLKIYKEFNSTPTATPINQQC